MTALSLLSVVQADGRAGTPTDRQRGLLRAARQVIEADPHFGQLPGATLRRGEINAGLTETQRGYLYVCYDVPGAVAQEFWARVGRSARVTWSTGQVSVALPVDPAGPNRPRRIRRRASPAE